MICTICDSCHTRGFQLNKQQCWTWVPTLLADFLSLDGRSKKQRQQKNVVFAPMTPHVKGVKTHLIFVCLKNPGRKLLFSPSRYSFVRDKKPNLSTENREDDFVVCSQIVETMTISPRQDLLTFCENCEICKNNKKTTLFASLNITVTPWIRLGIAVIKWLPKCVGDGPFFTATSTVLLQSNLADVYVIQIGDYSSIGGATTKQGH